ncbi:MAG TPA: glutamate 5-kinase, partial [Candidatus Acidoferrum sp.]|nr:glutamate 5-kinase [Candidatus Acidoferrum sp.]
ASLQSNDQPGNDLLRSAKRLVIKLGTSTVTGPQGELSLERIEPIVRAIATLQTDHRHVVLVSSGAVGLGRGWLGLHPSRLKDMATKQACAAVGQSLLMEAYKRLFAAYGVKIAQVLLTEEDFSNWQRYSNLRRTMEKLLGFGVLPIVNENDTVSTAELETLSDSPRSLAFSDNDRLAALVMSGLEADALILLTNVDGLLGAEAPAKEKRPTSASRAQVIPLISKITPELRSLASGPSQSGRGGMITKLEAAEIAMKCGGIAVIANGGRPETLPRIFSGESEGTVFLPSGRMKGKRRWLAYAASVRGRIVVDAGAQHAITRGKASLLSSGLVRVERSFAPMDVVGIANLEGHEFARGIANCASDAAAITRVLVTRDNIVLLERES